MSIESIFRCLVLKQITQLSYQKLAFHLCDSATYRTFARLKVKRSLCPPEVAAPMIVAESASVLPQTRFLKNFSGTLAPDEAARQIARGLDKGRPVIIPGTRAKLVDMAARYFPGTCEASTQFLLRRKFPRE